ncbi:MAG: radical SAM protein [Desulfovibrio sp.]
MNGNEKSGLRCPKVIWLTPAFRCNLRCPGCIHGLDRKGKSLKDLYRTDKKFMTFEEFQRVVDDTLEFRPLLSLYGAGEPFLNPDVYEMVRYAGLERKFPLQFHTNGLPLDPHRLAPLGPTDVTFSVDGFSQESYEKYRRGGDLKQVLEIIETFARLAAEQPQGLRPKITFKYIIHRFNEEEVQTAKDWVAKLPNVIFREAAFVLPAPDIDYRLEHKGWSTKESHDHWAPRKIPYDLYYFDEEHGVYKNRAQLLPRDGNCEMVKDELFAHVDGESYPCCLGVLSNYREGMYFGNIFEEGVLEVFNGERAERFRTIYRTSDKGNVFECAECQFNRLRTFSDAVKVKTRAECPPCAQAGHEGERAAAAEA